MPLCSTITWVRIRLTYMGLYNMHNINIYKQFRSPPGRHTQLVLKRWHLQWWIPGGSPYSSRRQAGRWSEHTPHDSENNRVSIGCKLACARICPAMPFDTICAIRGSAAEHSRLGLTRPVRDTGQSYPQGPVSSSTRR